MTTGFASIAVQIDLGTSPFAAAGTWTTLTNVQKISYRSGKSAELARYDPSTCDITLLNNDRKYDPTNTASALYPNLVPLRKVRVIATDSGSTQWTLWQGLIRPRDSITLNYAPGGTYSTATLHCVDYFVGIAGLNLASANVSRAAELAGARAAWALAAVGMDTSLFSCDTGITTMGAGVFDIDALEYLHRLAQQEGGAFYCSRGVATFDDRFAPLTKTRMTTSQHTFASTTDYVDIKKDYANRIYNDAQITAASGTMFEYQDSTSIIDYTGTTWSLNAPELSDNEAAQRGIWVVKQYKDPVLTPTSISFKPRTSSTLSDQAIQRSLRDQITVTFTSPGTSTGAETYTCFIDRVDQDISVDDWTVTYALSPLRFGFAASSSFLKLDDATLGKLDTQELAF